MEKMKILVKDSRVEQVKFVEGRPCHFKFFKGCFPQIILGPFLNTLTHIFNILQTDNAVFDF